MTIRGATRHPPDIAKEPVSSRGRVRMTDPAKNPDAGGLPAILAVIPLYKMRVSESAGLRTLQAAIRSLNEKQCVIQILLYDNSQAQDVGDIPDGVIYTAAAHNEGVAGPYNAALKLALQGGFKWFLTLDQDSTLPPDFLVRMLMVVKRLESKYRIGAIVPQLAQRDRLLSPVRIRPWGVSYLPRGSVGVMPGEIHAFNSASLFRVSALKQIGGFSREFWLDYEDAYVYRMLHHIGKKVYVAGNIQIEHDLSTLSQSDNLNPSRYRNFLQAESAFHDLYAGSVRRLLLSGRLLVRLFRHWKRRANPEIKRITRVALARRIFRSKTKRIVEWRNDVRRLFLSAQMTADEGFRERRPTISVCMATYNGGRYVVEQLRSILAQLAPGDEIIIVDDVSVDDTITKIEGVNDSRIRLLRNEKNIGVQGTFEQAIRASSGEILFLSDQDDIWAPQKVEKILAAFRSHPGVMLIATDNALIDEKGALVLSSYFAGRGKFRPGLCANLVRNRFGGCTMAFRAELISDILPFPRQRNVLHDIWIGVRTSISGHRSLYINEPLVLNRRHSTTATGRGALSLKRKLAIRFSLISALFEFWVAKHIAGIAHGGNEG